MPLLDSQTRKYACNWYNYLSTSIDKVSSVSLILKGMPLQERSTRNCQTGSQYYFCYSKDILTILIGPAAINYFSCTKPLTQNTDIKSAVSEFSYGLNKDHLTIEKKIPNISQNLTSYCTKHRINSVNPQWLPS